MRKRKLKEQHFCKKRKPGWGHVCPYERSENQRITFSNRSVLTRRQLGLSREGRLAPSGKSGTSKSGVESLPLSGCVRVRRMYSTPNNSRT